MKVVNIQAAKTHLSRLVEEAVNGEEIILAKAGKPFVRLVPCNDAKSPRVLGGWEGKVRIADDFDAESSEIVELFEGAKPAPAKAARDRPGSTKPAPAKAARDRPGSTKPAPAKRARTKPTPK